MLNLLETKAINIIEGKRAKATRQEKMVCLVKIQVSLLMMEMMKAKHQLRPKRRPLKKAMHRPGRAVSKNLLKNLLLPKQKWWLKLKTLLCLKRRLQLQVRQNQERQASRLPMKTQCRPKNKLLILLHRKQRNKNLPLPKKHLLKLLLHLRLLLNQRLHLRLLLHLRLHLRQLLNQRLHLCLLHLRVPLLMRLFPPLNFNHSL